jgi:Kdo2-lipid IVA lauroyltransferase/acyltransferase
MLADQTLNEGIPIPFFGGPAMTATARALLALRFDFDVLPARVERRSDARFQLTIFPLSPLPRTGDQNADVAALTAEVTAVLESWIRDRPGE